MSSKSIIISSEGSEKGRSFRAELLAYVTANSLWEIGGGGDKWRVRPVYALLACREGEAGPVIANLRLGRKAKILEDGRESSYDIEFLKSAKYDVKAQAHQEGVLIQIYQNELLRFDSPMVDPDWVRFVVLPAKSDLAPADDAVVSHVLAWAAGLERGHVKPKIEDAHAIARVSYLFAKQIFTRAQGPIPNDARFFAQALAALLDHQRAILLDEQRSRNFGVYPYFGFDAWGLDAVGMGPALAVSATHEDVNAILAEQVALYYEMVSE